MKRKIIESITEAIAKEMKQKKLNRLFTQRTAILCGSALCTGLISNFVEDIMYKNIEVILTAEKLLLYTVNSLLVVRYIKHFLKANSYF